MARPWWRDAVFYEIYVRSFADASGDGVGDLEGIRRRLPYLRDLGVDALWLTPFYRSPQADHGYDVADPRDVDPLFGDLDAFDALVHDAHDHGLRLTVDIVPNHVSDRHPWFQEALAAGPGSDARRRFLFRHGKGPRGEQPPNNWVSTFGGPAWTQVADGQWYLHLFAPEQPDLDWRHPDVAADFEHTLRFWLDRGVDGFRIDVAYGLFKDPAMPDHPRGQGNIIAETVEHMPMWNQPEVHEVYRSWRRVLDAYPGERMAVGEIWLGDPLAVAEYVRPDELNLAFNFRLLLAPWQRQPMRAAIEKSLAGLGAVGAPTTWVLSNHDVPRHVTRYGAGEQGARRARAALLLLLALPGPVYLYQGEELGLADVEVPEAARQDPVWERSGHTRPGRDGCRVPLPWSGDIPPYGFSARSGQPWLPQPAGWNGVTAEQQAQDGQSMLSWYRRCLSARRSQPALGDGTLQWLDLGGDVLAFRRPGRDGGRAVVCAVNMGGVDAPLPDGEVLLHSAPAVGTTTLPPDTAVWLAQ